nr:hypothetical protein CFP56_55369 [Quercus suber]
MELEREEQCERKGLKGKLQPSRQLISSSLSLKSSWLKMLCNLAFVKANVSNPSPFRREFNEFRPLYYCERCLADKVSISILLGSYFCDLWIAIELNYGVSYLVIKSSFIVNIAYIIVSLTI